MIFFRNKRTQIWTDLQNQQGSFQCLCLSRPFGGGLNNEHLQRHLHWKMLVTSRTQSVVSVRLRLQSEPIEKLHRNPNWEFPEAFLRQRRAEYFNGDIYQMDRFFFFLSWTIDYKWIFLLTLPSYPFITLIKTLNSRVPQFPHHYSQVVKLNYFSGFLLLPLCDSS